MSGHRARRSAKLLPHLQTQQVWLELLYLLAQCPDATQALQSMVRPAAIGAE